MTLGRYTLNEMVEKARRLCQAGPGNASINSLLKDSINAEYMELVSRREWVDLEFVDEIGLRKADESAIASLESTEREAPMPTDTLKIKSIQLFSPTHREVRITSPSEMYRMLGPSIDVSAPPELACIVGRTAQYRRIASNDSITVKSNVTTNNDDKIVRVVYRPIDGQVGETILQDVSGTFSGSGVTLTNQAAAGWSIESVHLPSGWDGNLTIEDSVTTVVEIPQRAVAAAGQQHARWYSRILMRFAPIPDADYKAMVSFRRVPHQLSDNRDMPLIPVSDVLINRAAAAYFRRERKLAVAASFEQKAEVYLRSIAKMEPQGRSPSLAPRRGVLGTVGMFQRRGHGR